jgi:DNA-directed RNA polymerase sigma subunit (sigma70/sigma32)
MTKRELIVDILQNSNPPKTLEEVGDMFGVTREYVRQVWATHTPGGYRRYRDYQQKVAYERNEKRLDSVKFECNACGTPVTYREGKYKQGLCHNCSDKFLEQRDPYIILTCVECGNEFSPMRNNPKRHESRYCSMDCYTSSKFFKDMISKGSEKIMKHSEEEYKELARKFHEAHDMIRAGKKMKKDLLKEYDVTYQTAYNKMVKYFDE